jgi:hypothetical protein
VDEVLQVDNITTERTWISTIPVTLERSECGISTSKATTSGSRLSTWTRYVREAFALKAMDLYNSKIYYKGT